VSNFCIFLEKRPLMLKFAKFCFERFHRLTDRRCCVQMSLNLSDGKSAKSCVIYLEKKQNFGCLSNCRYCSDRVQNMPRPAPNDVLTVLRIASKSFCFRRSNSRTRQHRFCPVECFHNSPEAMVPNFDSGE